VGVGDVGEVSGRPWKSRDASGGDDGGREGGQRESGLVDGHALTEHGQADECRRDGIRLGDSARVEHGTDDVHRTHPGREHDVRGDGVGVGDGGEVPDRARLAGHASGDDDRRGASQ
jgi:hypothetical protein